MRGQHGCSFAKASVNSMTAVPVTGPEERAGERIPAGWSTAQLSKGAHVWKAGARLCVWRNRRGAENLPGSDVLRVRQVGGEEVLLIFYFFFQSTDGQDVTFKVTWNCLISIKWCVGFFFDTLEYTVCVVNVTMYLKCLYISMCVIWFSVWTVYYITEHTQEWVQIVLNEKSYTKLPVKKKKKKKITMSTSWPETTDDRLKEE